MCTFGKHRQNIRAPPAPGASALIKHRVELHRILLPTLGDGMRKYSQMNFAAIDSQCERSRSCTPTLSNGTDVLVEASDERDMARAGFRGDASVRHTPGTPLFYHTPGKHTGKHN